ncbi:MAG TPA: Tol-Pal system beta propeller repeat protein TolB [Thermoanaerobaculia bacterium]|nr:Tol-Pal system beta propeller repeat protein TolB [Thermoanaerobaculia bacterium]
MLRWSALSLILVAALGIATLAQPPVPPTEPEPPPAAASDVVVELSGGTADLLRLALPAFRQPEILAGAARDAATEVERTLRADLDATEVFAVQGPTELAVLSLTGDPASDLVQVQSLGNQFLLSATLLREADRLVLEATLFDLSAGKSILGKRYRAGFDRARDVAHTLADEILAFLTGRAGIARTSIAFVSDRDQTGRKEIYLMDYDGFNQRRLTAHRSTSLSPSWTSDGQTIGYTSFFSGTPAIYTADVATGRKSPVVTSGRFNVTPSFSPDGQRVAFARSLDGNIEIFSASAAGTDLRQLTHSSAIDTNPAWSPKANEVAFTSSRGGSPQIYLMDPEGTNVRRISFEGEYNDNAAWGPDGTEVAYSSRRNGRFQIVVTNIVTLETRVLTSGPANSEDPSFSPDGRWLVFSRKEKGRTAIWMMSAKDGAGQRAITSEGNNDSPSWSPYPR